MDGGANHSRLVSITYPNERVITYDYNTLGSLNDVISRLDSIKDDGNILEAYEYLGMGTVVRPPDAGISAIGLPPAGKRGTATVLCEAGSHGTSEL